MSKREDVGRNLLEQKYSAHQEHFKATFISLANKLINSVICGELKSVIIDNVKLKDIREIIESHGCDNFEDFETNGWQVDFWLKVKIYNKWYMLAGDLYGYEDVTFSAIV